MDEMPARQQDRLAAHATRQFQECNDRTREGEGADGDAQAHFDQALRMDMPCLEDAEGFGRIERCRSHTHGC